MAGLMTFGKYKDKPIATVIAKDPRYALWAHRNVEFFKLSPSQVQNCVVRSDAPPFFPRSPVDDDDSHDGWGGMDYSDFGNR